MEEGNFRTSENAMSELDFMILDSESTLNDIDIERMQSLTCRANDIPLGTISAIPEPRRKSANLSHLHHDHLRSTGVYTHGFLCLSPAFYAWSETELPYFVKAGQCLS